MKNDSIEANPDSASKIDYSERIRQERSKRAWTQEKLAEMSGLSVRTVQRLECGESPAPETLKMLAAAFGIDAEELKTRSSRTIFHSPSNRRHSIDLLCVAYIAVSFFFLKNGIPTESVTWIGLLFFTIPILTFLFILPWIVTGISVGNGKVRVHRFGHTNSYDVAKVTGIARCPDAENALPIITAPNITGLYYNRLIGFHARYLTDASNAVLVEFGKTKIVVSPDDPNEFIAAVNDAFRCTGKQGDIPAPRCMMTVPIEDKGYGESIRNERIKRNWTQDEVAAKAGVSVRTVQRLENGAAPSPETLRLLAGAFGMNVSDFAAKPRRRHFKMPRTKIGQWGYWACYTIGFVSLNIPLCTKSPLVMGLSYAVFFIFFFNLFLEATDIGVRRGEVIVNCSGLSLRYKLSKLTGIEINPYATTGAIPRFLFPPYFFFFPPLLIPALNFITPWCRSSILGKFRSFVTDRKNCVYLEFEGKKIVVSPDDPQAFVQAVRDELKSLESAEDDPQPAH